MAYQQETISGLAGPYDYRADLGRREATPGFAFDKAYGSTTKNEGIQFGLGGARGTVNLPYYKVYANNPAYTLGTISDLNDPAKVYRGQQLKELLPGRQAAAQDTVNNLRTNLGQRNLLTQFDPNRDTQPGAKKLALYQQLQEKFGPGFRTVPEAQAMISDFDALMRQQADITKLDQLIEAGKKAEDYLSNEPLGGLLPIQPNPFTGEWGQGSSGVSTSQGEDAILNQRNAELWATVATGGGYAGVKNVINTIGDMFGW